MFASLGLFQAVGTVLLCAAMLSGCHDGAAKEGLPIAVVQVTLSPTVLNVSTGETASLTASVAGTSQTAVIWKVNALTGGSAAVGLIVGMGPTVSYLAPASSGIHTVTATSVADPTKSAATIVTVSAPVQVSLSPAEAETLITGTLSFTATVTGTTNLAVLWTVDGVTAGNATVGSITGMGSIVIYTAPGTPGHHTVMATSLADSTKSASAHVVVLPPVQVTLSPESALVDTNATLTLTATVSGTPNTALLWKVDGIANGNSSVGSLTFNGTTATYFAPATAGTHVVTAHSVADSTKSASCTVVVQTPILVKVVLAPSGPIEINTTGSLWFYATITGSTNTSVAWSVDDIPGGGSSLGTITGNGTRAVYTAPAESGIHVLKATSLEDPRSSSSAEVSVHPACAPAPTATLVVNVRNAPYNARGDGVTDDTSALQQAVNAVAGTGGTVTIPAGTYLVNPVVHSHAALRLGSRMTLDLADGAVLKAMSTSTSDYAVLLVSGVQNVTIRGGTLLGNRYNNTITDVFENGMGVEVTNSSQVVVEGLTAKEFWADGFYLAANARNVTLCSVRADNNRRNGMSIVSADGVVVRGSTFENSTGMIENGDWVCGSGVDLEPNLGERVDNIQLLGCTFRANASEGLSVGPSISNTGKAFVTQVVIDGNTATGNGLREGGAGIAISNTSGHQIIRNTVADNIGIGIYLRNQANNNFVSGNRVTGTRAAPAPGDIGYGILLYLTSGNTVSDNTVTTSAACGIRDAYPSGANTIGPNTLSDNHPNSCP